MCLEGGYGESLPNCVSHCVRSLIGDSDACLTEEELVLLPQANVDTMAQVGKVKEMLQEHWDVFS
jgi:hypothetical protein